MPLGRFFYVFHLFSHISHLLILFLLRGLGDLLDFTSPSDELFYFGNHIFNFFYSLSFLITFCSQFVAAVFYQIFLKNINYRLFLKSLFCSWNCVYFSEVQFFLLVYFGLPFPS